MNKNTIKKNKIRQDCWDLEIAFLKWLKERLPVYLKEAGKNVDLTYHKFYFEDRDWPQKELIERLIHEVNLAFETDYTDENHSKYIKNVNEIWALLLPAMWW